MRDEHISTANYAAVIADLRAKRDEIERTIAILEAMAGVAPVVGRRAHPPAEAVAPVASRTATVSLNNGIGEACARIVRENAGAALSTREVTDRLIASGFRINAENPINNVWSALNHRVKVTGDIEQVDKRWRYVGGAEKAATPEGARMNGAHHA